MNIHYYNVLGFNNNKPSQDEIKASYRSLTKQCHPDIFPGDIEKEQEFKAIIEAYEVLSDVNKRRVYDQYGYSENEGGEEKIYADAEREFINLFEQVFNQIPAHVIHQVNLKQVMMQALEQNKVQHMADLDRIKADITKLKIPLKKIKSRAKKNLLVTFLNNKIQETYKQIENKNRIIRVLDMMKEIGSDYDYENNTSFLISNTSSGTSSGNFNFFRS